jgi:hypothetical protein
VSFLHPLFLLAAAAVAVPVVLHLARRRTRTEQPWSSLRFLASAPPRLERRRRLEHWLLLALRCLAVALLAVAFARPFLTRPLPALSPAGGRRVVLLLDTSASMRREGLWAEALARARRHLGRAAAGDRLAVLAFDGRVRPLLGFEAWAAAPAAERRALAEARLALAAPGWGATDVGAALVAAGEAVLDDEVAAGQAGAAASGAREVVLISDLPQGSRLAALQAADWPRDLRLVLERLAVPPRTNLGLQALAAAGGDGDGAAARVRLRVSASQEGDGARATLAWEGSGGAPVELRLGPGETRALDAPARPAGPGVLALVGDGDDFDNRLAVAPPVPAPALVVYVGEDDGRDPAGALYFVGRAFPATRTRAPRVEAHRPDGAALAAALGRADLVVATAAPGAAGMAALRAYLDRGRLLLFAPRAGTGAAAGAALGALLGVAAVPMPEAPAGREAVLTAVDLRHPLLAPFAEGDGRAGDFTHIRFWRRRALAAEALPGARVLARFDDGGPAWLAAPAGAGPRRGTVLVMTSGWDLGDSQLALSSRLPPLLWGLLDASAGGGAAAGQLFVGDPLPVAVSPAGGEAAARVHTPDGSDVSLPAGARAFTATDQPGLYTLAGPQPITFAVNVPPAESQTAPLPIEALERLGIPTSDGAAAAPAVSRDAEAARRASFFAELERTQRPWRFVLLAVLLVLLVEAALLARRERAA